MKTVMMVATKRAGEPCDEIAPTHVVRFDPTFDTNRC
jgi:hypothetical protein